MGNYWLNVGPLQRQKTKSDNLMWNPNYELMELGFHLLSPADINRRAGLGNAEAIFIKGDRLCRSIFTLVDMEAGNLQIHEAARLGHPVACARFSNPTQSITILEKCARMGHAVGKCDWLSY
jgi:hypothetical protein